MDKTDLKTIVLAEINDAAGYASGDLSTQRARAMDYYLGEPFGNEVDGRSQVVSTDVADTIEWIKPALLKTFAASDEAVRFDAVGEDDEEKAEQETDVCNHVFYKENPGFLILYTWFNDALLQKNGIVKIYWDDAKEVKREEYSGIDDDEFYQLLADEELEPLEHTEETVIESVMTEMGEMQQERTSHDVVFKRTRKKGKATISPVPPEEFLVNRDHNSLSLQDAAFVAHRTDKRVSQLIEMGYPRELVENLPSDENTSEAETEESLSRKHLDEERSPANRSDKAMRSVRVHECYIRIDYDGDGIAELRKVTIAGNEILDNEEVDCVPFEAITPVILSHKFYGLSVADLVRDLQLIKSTLWRQTLDNLYLSNNPMREAVEGQVNIDDLMASRVGGIVRTKQPGMVNNLDIPFVAGNSFQMMEYIDRVRQERTGVSENSMGQNQALLNDTAHGIERLMTAAEARIELIARIFAETGVKGMFLQIRALLQKHQDKAKTIKLRNKWVQVDPREWRERANMTIKVGLGTGDRLKLQTAIGGVMAAQEKLISGGGLGKLVSPKNIYNAVSDYAKYSGLMPEQYFTDPDTIEAETDAGQGQPQKQPNPLAEAEEVKGRFRMQEKSAEFQLKGQLEQMRMANERQLAEFKMQLEAERDSADRRSKEAIEAMKAEIGAMIKGYQIDVGAQGIGAGVQES